MQGRISAFFRQLALGRDVTILLNPHKILENVLISQGKIMGKEFSFNPSNFVLLVDHFSSSTQYFESNSKQVFSPMMRNTEHYHIALLLRIETRFLVGDIFKIHSKGATPIENFSDPISFMSLVTGGI